MGIDWQREPDGGAVAQVDLPLTAEWGQYLQALRLASCGGETWEDGVALANDLTAEDAQPTPPPETATVHIAESTPSARELIWLDRLVRKWPALAAKIRDAADSYYRDELEAQGAPPHPGNLLRENYFRLDTVYLSDAALGLAGESFFDEEHGIGFRLEKGHVTVGGADIAMVHLPEPDESDNAFDTWNAPVDWQPPKRDTATDPVVNPLRELRQQLGSSGFRGLTEAVIVSRMSAPGMPESLRAISTRIAELPDAGGRLRIDLGLPGPDCAADRRETAEGLRQQLSVLGTLSLEQLLAGLADDGSLTLPPMQRPRLLALALQLYDIGLDADVLA